MALEIITLRRLSYNFQDARSVSVTADFKLISFLTKDKELKIINLLHANCGILTLHNTNTYLWQEDASTSNLYRVLCIEATGDLVSYMLDVQGLNSGKISILHATKWCTKTNLQTFIPLVKGKKSPQATSILKYESKEAVICYDEKYVINFFLSTAEDPKIMSFADVTESSSRARQISFVKETIFVLDYSGSTLSAFSCVDNSKVLEVDLMSCGLTSEVEAVQSFEVSLEKDIAVLNTGSCRLYYLVLNDYWESFAVKRSRQTSVSTAVTAFTKQFPSVQQFGEGQKRSSISLSSNLLQPINFTCDTTDCCLEYIALYNGKLCFVFCGEDCIVIGVHQIGIEKPTSYQRLAGKGFMLECSSETFPLLFIHEGTLSILLYDIEQNKLINELMMYQCSGSAEVLSNLNNWQNIVIDFEVLKEALNNRQLDAVKFYLKTHEERYCQFLNQRNANDWLSQLERERTSWIEIMDLLLNIITSTVSDPSSVHFVEELIQIVTSFSLRLLRAIANSLSEDESDEIASEKIKASLYFSQSIRKLREERNVGGDVEVPDESVLSPRQDVSYPSGLQVKFEKWDERNSWKEVYKESLIEGCIAMAQSYFLNHRDVSKRKYGKFVELYKYGIDLVFDFLKQGCLPEAITVLLNLGVPVNEKLQKIFMSTCDRDIRKTLLREIKLRHLLSADDEETVNFVFLLEKLYPCASFQHARLLQEEKSSHLEEWYKCAFPDVDIPELIVGDLVPPNWNNSETGAYCCISVNTVSLWSKEVRERIILPHYLKGLSNVDMQISPVSVWNYLLEYGDLPLILKWISNWLGQLKNHSPKEFPYGWSLNESMINGIPQFAPVHVAEAALNDLAKFGVFCEEELEDISLLLSRCGKVGCDLIDPTSFLTEKSTISFSDLSHRIVHYCLKHNLINFLYAFWTKCYDRYVTWPTCQLCDVPLLRMLKAFGVWSQNSQDAHSAYNAMLTSAEHFFNIVHLNHRTLLTQLPAPLNIAILLYYPQRIRDMLNSNVMPESEVKIFKEALLQYPLLYDSFFKTEQDRMMPEVSVYQLLQGNSRFDVSRLFGWQPTNLLKTEESLSVLPHFSLNALCEQHGLKESLTHFYYLIEGRPNFAYLKFLAQELSQESRISLSRVRLACKQVSRFALSRFRDVKICAACVLFLEMLGQDSLRLRTCLINANMLYEQQCLSCDTEEMKDERAEEIGFLFQSAEEDKETATRLVHILESEIFQKWKTACPKATTEDMALLGPFFAFANFYEVTAGECFLEEFAKRDDWLKFLVFAQAFAMPRNLTLSAAQKFSNQCIGNHFYKAFEKKRLPSEKVHHLEKEQFRRKTDLRKSLYSRLGVTKLAPPVQETVTQESEDESASICSEDTTSSDPESGGGSVVISKDLFSQILSAHNTDVPWLTLLHASLMLHNPVLSVLAASCPDSDLFYCFTTWLATAFKMPDSHVMQSFVSTQQFGISWSEEDFEELLTYILRAHKILTLHQGVFLFLPHSPLLALMKFLVSFLVYKKLDSSVEDLKEFQRQLWDYNETSDMSSRCHSLVWIQSIASLILKEAVVNCSINYERQLFLRHLYFTGIENTFSKEVSVPTFNKLYQMLQCIGELKEGTCVEHFLLPSSNPEYKKTCWKSVEELIQKQAYSEAKAFAKVACLQLDEVLILQVTNQSVNIRKSKEWESLNTRIEFWKNIFANLRQNNVKATQMIKFFKNQCIITDRYGEKCFLTQLIVQCMKENETLNTSEASSLKAVMWVYCMKEIETQPLLEFDLLLPQENARLFMEPPGSDLLHIPISSREEKEAINKIICRLLERKEVNEALHVGDLFDYPCSSLEIVKICLILAKGEQDSQLYLVNIPESEDNVSPSRRRKSVASWASCAETEFQHPVSIHEDTSSQQYLTSSQITVVRKLEALCSKTKEAVTLCERILINYIVSAVLSCPYDVVTEEENPFVLIKRILGSDYKDKFSLARSLITVHELSDESVANFLSLEIYFSIQSIPESSAMLPENKLVMPEDGDEILYNPSIPDEVFQLTVKLCHDPSVLGRLLVDMLSSVFSNFEVTVNSGCLVEAVELCICSHNCFTAACNVEGISRVLRKCKQVVAALAKSGNFAMMIPLLTRVGRYSEMSYIFDILLENGKFELLFGKKMEKDLHLRLALLDYLKRCPSAEHYYSMLLETFSMYREIAEDAERSARKRLAQLSKRTTDAGLKVELENVIKELTHAAKNYMEVNCVHQAQFCADLARLVALQFQVHPVWIIGLDEVSVSRCLATTITQFSQAIIIADVYKHQHSWSQAVFNHVILKDNKTYLRDMQSYLGVSESVIEDVAKSFYTMQNKNEAQVRNMKWLLSFCSDIEIKYQLANQLGFTDIVTELLMGDGGAFLQDTFGSNLQL